MSEMRSPVLQTAASGIPPVAAEPFVTFVLERVEKERWDKGRQAWQAGTLQEKWFAEHPDLFTDEENALITQRQTHWYAEAFAAVILKQRFGMRSLLAKYDDHGVNSHPLKQRVLQKYLSPELHAFVISNKTSLVGARTRCPDLFVYGPGKKEWFFCEVKGPKDKLSQPQVRLFKMLEERSGRSERSERSGRSERPVRLFQFVIG